jgi:uncharacterized protein
MTQPEPASQASPETTSVDAPAMQSPFADWPGGAPWQPLPDAARRSFMLTGLLNGAVVAAAFASPSVLMFFESGEFNLRMLVWSLSLSLVSVAVFFWRARLAFAYARWMLDDDGLRVRRGRYWRREILVPRARVQHLDVERGPIERRYGLATLIVHTAGTRMQALRQPGFDEATAARLRDALVPQHREMDDAANADVHPEQVDQADHSDMPTSAMPSAATIDAASSPQASVSVARSEST